MSDKKPRPLVVNKEMRTVIYEEDEKYKVGVSRSYTPTGSSVSLDITDKSKFNRANETLTLIIQDTQVLPLLGRAIDSFLKSEARNNS
jgi:hypothetical protein